jgi:predicted transcriptional regulator
VPDKNIAKALKRKIGLDVSILAKTEYEIGEQSLLMNPSRRKIFQYLCNHPCSHLREISRATSNSPQTVRWHMRKLIEANLITESVYGKKKIFTPLRNIITTEECKIINLLREEEKKNVYLAIEHNPKVTQKKLCETLNIYQQKLSLVLRKLIISGLIFEDKISRVKVYSVTNKINELKEGLTQKSDDFIIVLMDALKADSLNPKIEGSSEDTIIIRVTIGGEESAVLHINKNPINTIMDRK